MTKKSLLPIIFLLIVLCVAVLTNYPGNQTTITSVPITPTSTYAPDPTAVPIINDTNMNDAYGCANIPDGDPSPDMANPMYDDCYTPPGGAPFYARVLLTYGAANARIGVELNVSGTVTSTLMTKLPPGKEVKVLAFRENPLEKPVNGYSTRILIESPHWLKEGKLMTVWVHCSVITLENPWLDGSKSICDPTNIINPPTQPGSWNTCPYYGQDCVDPAKLPETFVPCSPDFCQDINENWTETYQGEKSGILTDHNDQTTFELVWIFYGPGDQDHGHPAKIYWSRKQQMSEGDVLLLGCHETEGEDWVLIQDLTFPEDTGWVRASQIENIHSANTTSVCP